MDEPNELSRVRRYAYALQYYNRYAIQHRMAGGAHITKNLVRILHFREADCVWIVERCEGEQRHCQARHPENDCYLTLMPFENPLAKIVTMIGSKPFIGMEVLMWQEGWHPDKKHNPERLTIHEYNPSRSIRSIRIHGSPTYPWWCYPDHYAGVEWYAQASDPRLEYYIVPASVFDPKEAKTPAESLARIFLGG